MVRGFFFAQQLKQHEIKPHYEQKNRKNIAKSLAIDYDKTGD